MERNIKSKCPKCFNAVILFLLGLVFLFYLYLFVVFAIIDLLKRNYLYLAIQDPVLLIATIVLSVILPLLLCLGCGFSLKLKKWSIKITVIIVCFLLLAVWIIPNVILLGLGGGIASYTENIENCGKFDQSVKSILEKYLPEDFFPRKDALNENSHYSYYYEYGLFDEYYHIQLDAQFIGQTEYDAEQTRLTERNMIPVSENTYFLCDDNQITAENMINTKALGVHSYAIVHCDDKNRQITYELFCSEDSVATIEYILKLAE